MAENWLNGYITVNERVISFRKQHPLGAIKTEAAPVKSPEGAIVEWAVKAEVYDENGALLSTGYSSMKVPGTSNFTRGAELENAETSAVGRALGFLGIGIDKSVASADEVKAKSAPSPKEASAPSGNGKAVVGFIEKWTDDGFALKAGSTRYQVVVDGVVGDHLQQAYDLGDKVSVTGPVTMVAWNDKSGKKMPPYKRLAAESVGAAA